MLKPNSWQSHDEYKAIVKTYSRRLSRNNPKYAFDQYEKQCQKLLNLSLDPILGYISQFYSNTGRPAKNQAQILHSLILFVMLFNCTSAKTSLTAWVRDVLPSSISLMVLVSCTSAEELPPLGSCYDFMDRFWLATHDACSRASLLPTDKNSKKPEKTSAVMSSS